MKLYIMRHAEAVEGSDILRDEWRYLTEKGRAAARAISSAIVKYGPKPRLTVTSPLTRAVQTAEIVGGKACRRNVIVASELLLPGARIEDLVAFLRKHREAKRVILVGHEPQLGTIVATLLGCQGAAITLKKAACVALDFDPDKDGKPAAFLWYLAPGRKRTTSFKKAFR
jgi:phosphohistidine phosphatase